MARVIEIPELGNKRFEFDDDVTDDELDNIINNEILPSYTGKTVKPVEKKSLEKTMDDLRFDEASGTPELASYSDRGGRSIGYGYYLNNPGAKKQITDLGYDFDKVYSGEQEITDKDADTLLAASTKTAESDARKLFKNYDDLSEGQQRALINMSYQLGGPSLAKFEKFRKAVEEDPENIDEALKHMADSNWAKGFDASNNTYSTGEAQRAARVMQRYIGGAEKDEIAASNIMPIDPKTGVPIDVPADVPFPTGGNAAAQVPADVPVDVPFPGQKKESVMKPVKTGVLESLADYVADTYKDIRKGMQFEESTLTGQVTEALTRTVHQYVPEYDADGQLLDIRKETEEEQIARRNMEREIAMHDARMDEVGEGARITGEMLAIAGDPIAWVAFPTRALQAANLFGRAWRLATIGGGYEAGAETLRQVNEKSDLDEFELDEIARKSAIGALGGAVGGEAIYQGARLGKYIYKKAVERATIKARMLADDPRPTITHQALIDKEAERIVKSIEERTFEYRSKGLNPGQSFHRAMRDEGLLPEQLPDLFEKAGRRPIVDPAGQAAFNPSSGLREGGVLGRTSTGKFMDKLVGVVSTRIGNYSPALKAKIRKFDYDVHKRAKDYSDRAEEFLSAMSKLPKEIRQELNKRLASQDREGAMHVINRMKPGALKDKVTSGLRTVSLMLDEIHKDLNGTGIETGYLPQYFPRSVKDYEKLVRGLGREKQDAVLRHMQDIDLKRRDKGEAPLTTAEREGIINQYIKGVSALSKEKAKPGFTKERKIEELDDAMLQHYDDPQVALSKYLQYAAHTMEKAKLFGKNLDFTDITDPRLRNTLAKWVQKEHAEGNLTAGEVEEVTKLIASRFRGGEAETAKGLQAVKNLFYIPTLGQISATVTQAGDVFLGMYKVGVMNAVRSILGNGTKVTMDDIGLNTIAAELSSTGRTAKLLNGVLKATQFKKMDALGKQVILTGGLHKFEKMVKTHEGAVKFAKKYGVLFRNQDEVNEVITALQKGDVTENVKFLLWNELADMQPISLSELPEAYLNSPNGRILYMLKTFVIKQADIIRRDVVQELEKGNYKTGGQNLAKFTAAMMAAGMSTAQIKDWITNKETPIDDVVASSLLKSFMLSDYLVEKGLKGDISAVVTSLVMPPFNTIGSVVSDIGKMGQQWESLRHVPGVGGLAYAWFGGGIEREARKQKEYARERKKDTAKGRREERRKERKKQRKERRES